VWKIANIATFANKLGIFADGSLDDRVDSTQPDYVHRQMREEYITDTSATIVLCGGETWKRKFVDWEIHSTLLKVTACWVLSPRTRLPLVPILIAFRIG
jgi:hypothetical protein